MSATPFDFFQPPIPRPTNSSATTWFYIKLNTLSKPWSSSSPRSRKIARFVLTARLSVVSTVFSQPFFHGDLFLYHFMWHDILSSVEIFWVFRTIFLNVIIYWKYRKYLGGFPDIIILDTVFSSWPSQKTHFWLLHLICNFLVVTRVLYPLTKASTIIIL